MFGAGIEMIDVVAEAERQAGKPIRSGDVAMFWATLMADGAQPRSSGWGRLLDSLLAYTLYSAAGLSVRMRSAVADEMSSRARMFDTTCTWADGSEASRSLVVGLWWP